MLKSEKLNFWILLYVGLVINMNELQIEFGKCVKNFKKSRDQLRKCIEKAIDRGLTQKEIITVVDRYFSGDCELCTAMVLAEILRYEFKDRIHPNYEK